jgi:hypothetical protein
MHLILVIATIAVLLGVVIPTAIVSTAEACSGVCPGAGGKGGSENGNNNMCNAPDCIIGQHNGESGLPGRY